MIPYLFVPLGWVNYSRSSRLETASIISCCVQINQKYRKQPVQVSTWQWPINYSTGHANQDLFHFPFFPLVYLKCENEFLNPEGSANISFGWCANWWMSYIVKVATERREQGIWIFNFRDRKNPGNLSKNITNMILFDEFTPNTGKIKVLKKIGCM